MYKLKVDALFALLCKTKLVKETANLRFTMERKCSPPGAIFWDTHVLIYPKENPAKPKVNLAHGILGPPQSPANPKASGDLHPKVKHFPVFLLCSFTQIKTLPVIVALLFQTLPVFSVCFFPTPPSLRRFLRTRKLWQSFCELGGKPGF